jgi:hypothetical protein
VSPQQWLVIGAALGIAILGAYLAIAPVGDIDPDGES